MKIGSFIIDGRASYGAFIATGDHGGGVIDLSLRLGERYPDLLALLEEGGLAEAEEVATEAELEGALDHALDGLVYLPPFIRPTDIYCCGRNYRDHVAEMGHAAPPEHPSLFMKTLGALVGHDAPIVKPRVSEQFDYEAELAVVIGTGGRHIAPDEAMAHVAGYTCLMDGSVRDWQQRSTDQGKNFASSSSIGPWLATPGEVPAPDRWDTWRIQGRLNGQLMQDSTIGALIHGVPALIAYYSTIAELQPGDIISTGTCAGVGHGRTPPVYLQPGDVFEVVIDGIGVLRNAVVAEG